MRKILIADDEFNLRFVLREILEPKEYEIYEAENGEEALEIAMKIKPDILVIDNAMPRMTGCEVVEKINGIEQRCKVIMLSAKAQKTDIEYGLGKGVDHYVTKPFDLMEFSDLIDNLATAD